MDDLTTDREARKRAFLDAAGWGEAVLSPLAGDASNRRYQRVAHGPADTHCVLMDAPAERGEDIGRFLAFTGWLCDQNFSAPRIIAASVADGFALIEDLGDDLYARVAMTDPGCERQIYAAAVDLLAALPSLGAPHHVSGSGAAITVEPYDMTVLLREAMLVMEWWYPASAKTAAPQGLIDEFAAIITSACAGVAQSRDVLVLRDYHAENLLWLPDRLGHGQVGLLDYQDALAGSPAYDLVSLLEDARRDTSQSLQEEMIARYINAVGISEEVAFRRDYAVLGAQRNLKIIGIFARLWLRDGKPDYLALIPRVWAHLQRDLVHPALADLKTFIDGQITEPTDQTLADVRAARP